MATALSGRTSFVEVVDEYEAAHLPDALQQRIQQVLDDSANNG
jgi:hypothetical protein